MRLSTSLFLSLLFTLSYNHTAMAHIGFWSETYTITHQLTNGESIASAKQIMQEKARIKASFNVRNYQFMNKPVNLTNYKQYVPIIQATYMKITPQNKPQIVKDKDVYKGQIFVVQQIRATFDEHYIGQSIATLRNSPKVEKSLITLDNEFDNNLKNLGEIKLAIAEQQISTQQSARLIRQQDHQIMQLTSVLDDVKRLFSAHGHSPQFNLTQLLKVRDSIDAEVIDPILNTKVRTRIINVEELDNGDVKVQVQVGWTLPIHHMRILHKYVRSADATAPGGSSTYLKLSRFYNEKERAPSILSANIYNYLASQKIYFDISIGSQHQMLGVLYPNGGDLMNNCNNPLARDADSPAKTSICIVEQVFNDQQILSQPNIANPLTFTLNANEINGQLTVNVKQIWQKPASEEDKQWRRDLSKFN
ncbi:sugar fermentation stimulation protein [Moritella sp. 36]|uniref:sugar fermentation stimulation protein n=1 Tax=Moritella sp. 36 TaxID=2746233 RepID=UPI001BAD30A9|nr:sugar fermentation stimulation protein [Moritella sp. 36]QUM88049.1 sugar fermentation stimulation protein [Moritella sp. 36]